MTCQRPFAAAAALGADVTCPGRGATLRDHESRAALWDSLGPALASQPLGTQLYVCGPLAMIDAVTQAARALHWPEARIRNWS